MNKELFHPDLMLGLSMHRFFLGRLVDLLKNEFDIDVDCVSVE
jgi:hypothetical protein